jgi:hypothetical protein
LAPAVPNSRTPTKIDLFLELIRILRSGWAMHFYVLFISSD